MEFLDAVKAEVARAVSAVQGVERVVVAADVEVPLKPEEAEAPVNGRYERSYRYTVVDTIGGGTSEIQRGIIAKFVLGLPS